MSRAPRSRILRTAHLDDPVHHPRPPGMHRCDHSTVHVSEQHRRAVGDQRCQAEPRGRGHQPVGGRHRSLAPRSVDDGDVRTVALTHEEESISLQPKGFRHCGTVALDDSRVVAHVAAEVERVEGRNPGAAACGR